MAKAEKILLIDDNDTTNFLNSMVIQKSSHNIDVEVFRDPMKALDFLKENQHSVTNYLIFLDINMPVIDGWEFAKQYESLKISADNVLIMLTSSIDPKDEENAKENSVIDDYRSKPLTFEMLDQIFSSYFD